MKVVRTVTSLLLLAAVASAVHAEAPKTRDQVKAELREAVRSGDVYAAGDSGQKLNELYPERYPHSAVQGATRAQVQAELVAAMHEGSLIPAGEGGSSLRDEFPARYPVVASGPARTREDVVAETREAIRTGDMYAAGEGGMKLNEEFPQRYAKQRAVRMAQAPAAAASASAR